MEAEHQHQEPQSRTIELKKDPRGRLSFVDSRDTLQAQMIATIQRSQEQQAKSPLFVDNRNTEQIKWVDIIQRAGVGVVQRNITNAQNFRTIAIGLPATLPHILPAGRTTAISNRCFAITPETGIQNRRSAAASTGKTHAGSIRTVRQGDRYGNHAEKKLMRHDAGLTEIGVDRAICSSCQTAILANTTLQHVSDPNGTYRANDLQQVAL